MEKDKKNGKRFPFKMWNSTLSRPCWKQRSTSAFQAGRQPAWCEATPASRGATRASFTASGCSALHRQAAFGSRRGGGREGGGFGVEMGWDRIEVGRLETGLRGGKTGCWK